MQFTTILAVALAAITASAQDTTPQNTVPQNTVPQNISSQYTNGTATPPPPYLTNSTGTVPPSASGSGVSPDATFEPHTGAGDKLSASLFGLVVAGGVALAL